jgi:hypothetical protein
MLPAASQEEIQNFDPSPIAIAVADGELFEVFKRPGVIGVISTARNSGSRG